MHCFPEYQFTCHFKLCLCIYKTIGICDFYHVHSVAVKQAQSSILQYVLCHVLEILFCFAVRQSDAIFPG